jgi:hypothetical protein
MWPWQLEYNRKRILLVFWTEIQMREMSDNFQKSEYFTNQTKENLSYKSKTKNTTSISLK